MTTSTTVGRRVRLTWGDGVAALAAVAAGAFGAFSYYGDTILRPFAHTFTWRQIGVTALLLIPGTVVGAFLVSAPDWAQRFLRL